ncbi:MAG TPA: methylmalonyl-CoA mutase family protein [Blastocatellia bacterium]|nr:methylmalonyl-CoA mutase family protein [Blastocatellia bacterium]
MLESTRNPQGNRLMSNRKQKFTTSSDIELKNAFTAADITDPELGAPGQYPFTRGVYETMYRSRLWTMRQYAGFSTAKESNERYKYLLSQGTTGLSVAFDLPTQIGYDSDHELASGEVGKVGVAIDSLADMEQLFDGIPLDKVSTSMTINATASILLALYIAVGKKQGVSPDKLNGTIQNDILKEYIARGTYIYPPKPSLRIITDIFAYCAQEVPNWNTISISGYHIREAGSTAVQEVAFTLADGICYVQAALDAGLEVDKFAPRLAFFFNSHNNFLEEVAKFRAARRLWAKIMKDRFGARDPKSQMLRFHTQTAGSTLTAQQPEVNVIRTTIQALAAVLGGTQSLHTNGRDEALSLPTEDAARIALRTQQVIAHESGVADIVDALGGSYAIEFLTNEIERRAVEYITKIDEMGGMLAAIEAGYVQREIERAAYDYQKAVEAQTEIVVGVNKFQIAEDAPIPTLKIDPATEEAQKQRVQKVRAERNADAAMKALAEVENAAKSDENLMPRIIAAVESYATLGEIADAMRRVFGEYTDRA